MFVFLSREGNETTLFYLKQKSVITSADIYVDLNIPKYGHIFIPDSYFVFISKYSKDGMI